MNLSAHPACHREQNLFHLNNSQRGQGFRHFYLFAGKSHVEFICDNVSLHCRRAQALRRRKSGSTWRFCQRRKVKDFFIKFKKKSHFADFLTEQTLDFVLHRLFCGLAEMDTDDIGCLADLLSDSRASGGVGCGIVHSKSSCK